MKKTKLYIKTIVLAICIVCCSFVNVNAQQPIQIKENGILYKIVESNPKIEDEQILLTEHFHGIKIQDLKYLLLITMERY